MSRDNLFDAITRILGSPMPRRQAFKLIAGGLTGGTLVSLLEPKQAHAQQPKCFEITWRRKGDCDLKPGCRESDKEICCPPRKSGEKCICHVPVKGGCPTSEQCIDTMGSITAIRNGPPAQADVTIQNAVEGISSISLAKAVNCTVAGLPKIFSPPKTSPILLTATKTDQTRPAQFEFNVCKPEDLSCCPIDPIFTVLKFATGQWVRQTFADVPQAEHFITVTNGNPGLKRLHIWINSKHYATLKLGDNETRSLNLARAMTETDNTISLVGAGELGASASVAIVDTPPETATDKHGPSAMAAAQAQNSSPRHNATWGPLAEETEENSHLHVANAASQTAQVNFNGALNGGAASNPSAFTVEVNGKAAAVQTVHVKAGASGLDLTLQLPRGTLHRGDSVDVYWENLRNAKGRPLSGHVGLFAD